MNVLADWNLDDRSGGHRIDPYCGCRVRHARLLLDLVLLSLVVIGRPFSNCEIESFSNRQLSNHLRHSSRIGFLGDFGKTPELELEF